MEYFNESLYGLLDNLHSSNKIIIPNDLDEEQKKKYYEEADKLIKIAGDTLISFINENKLFNHHEIKYNKHFKNEKNSTAITFIVFYNIEDVELFKRNYKLGREIAMLMNKNANCQNLFEYFSCYEIPNFYFALVFHINKNRLDSYITKKL